MSSHPDISIASSEREVVVTLRGELSLRNVTQFVATLRTISTDLPVRMDLSGVTRFDTAAAWALARFQTRFDDAAQQLEISGAGAGPLSLLKTVTGAMPTPTEAPKAPMSIAIWLAGLGERVAAAAKFGMALIGYFGLFLARMARSVRHPREFRLTAFVHHCEDVGLKAVPIVALMAFLIGVVLAFQGSTQLRQFGAEVFVVDLIAVSILRELCDMQKTSRLQLVNL